MKMKQLEYLLKIVQCGSISRAAQELFVSQPTLTKSVLSLEEEYGVKLLVRKSRGVELTQEGKSFAHYARGVLTAAQALESNFNAKPGAGRSRLFVATQQLDFIYDLVLKTYLQNQEYSVHYNLVETDRNDVTRLVLDGKVDLGLLVRSNTDAKTFLWHTEARRLNAYSLAKAGVYVCLGPLSPYYRRQSLRFAEAAGSLQVVLDMEAAAKQDLYVDNVNNHFNMDRIIFFNSISACERFLIQTDAVMYAAKWAIGCFRDPRIRAVPIVDRDSEEIRNELLLIKRIGEPLTPTEMQFVGHLYAYFGREDPQM